MVKSKYFFVLSLLLFMLSNGWAQKVRFEISGGGGSQYPCQKQWVNIKLTNSNGMELFSASSGGTHYVDLDIAPGWSGMIYISAGKEPANYWETCSAASASASGPLSFQANTCNNFTYSNGNHLTYVASVVVKIYYVIGDIFFPPNFAECGSENFRVELRNQPPNASIQWQISSTNAFNPSTTKTIAYNGTTSIVITPSHLTINGITYNERRFIRAIGNDCPSNRTKISSSFFSYPGPPEVQAVEPRAPLCYGDSLQGGRLYVKLKANPVIKIVRIEALNEKSIDGIPTVREVDLRNLAPLQDGSYEIVQSGFSTGTHTWSIKNFFSTSSYGSCGVNLGKKTIINTTPVKVELIPSVYTKGFNLKCKGDSTGAISVNVSGGTGSYNNFEWQPNVSSTSNAENLTEGNYVVKVKDSYGCEGIGSSVLTSPERLSIGIISRGGKGNYDVSCLDKADGILEANVSGGVEGYSYSWSNNATTRIVELLSVGFYKVSVKDQNNCLSEQSITLSAPPAINFSIVQELNLVCPQDQTASLQVNDVVNTIGAVQYRWSSGEATPSISNKGAGSYSLTVSDEQGCSATRTKTIDRPEEFKASIKATSDYNGVPIRCNGEENGAIVAEVRNASDQLVTAEFYSWTKNSQILTEGVTANQLANVGKGQYKVTVKYRSRCLAESSIFLLDDPQPINGNVSFFSNYNGYPIRCNGDADGSIMSSPTGGKAPFTYRWDNAVTENKLTNIPKGTYTVVVNDINGCKGESTIEVFEPDPLAILFPAISDYNGFGVSCHNSTNGFVTASAQGGAGGYTYEWSTSAKTPSLSSLSAGTYVVNVKDKNNCITSSSIILEAPTPLGVNLESTDVTCFEKRDGQINVLSSGGVLPYQYSRNSVDWQTAPGFQNLNIGNHSIHVKDKNNCLQILTTSLTQPEKINISFSDVEPAFCDRPTGKATAHVSGGVSNYRYLWTNSADVTVSTSSMLNNVLGGIYKLLIHDGNNCPMEDVVAVTSVDGAKSTYESIPARCFDSADGQALISITEGVGPFSIQWPDGQQSLRAVNLRRGDYNVSITDKNNCTVVQTVRVNSPDLISLQVADSRQPTCFGYCDGEIKLAAIGGVGDYKFNWNEKNDAYQQNLCAAVFPVHVEDGHGCQVISSVELAQPEVLRVLKVNEKLPTCQGGCDGKLEITGIGGNGGYSFLWPDNSSHEKLENICSGTYKVSIEDRHGCQGTSIVELADAPALPLDLGGGVTLCVGQTYLLNAGNQWKSVTWKMDNAVLSNNPSITVKDPGRYHVSVVSQEDCHGEDVFILQTSYDLLKASFLIPREAQVQDTVVMIDISWPLPEKVEWKLPSEMVTLQDRSGIVYGQFMQPGEYQVGMTARLQECMDYINKIIIIHESDDLEESGRWGYEEFVKEFSLAPNPNDGRFAVAVKLLEPASIVLSVWNSPSGVLVAKSTGQGASTYKKDFSLELPSGVYVLRLDYPGGKRYLRFVVF